MSGEFFFAGSELRAGLLAAHPGIAHGFGTRDGASPEGTLTTVKQIHSTRVVDAATILRQEVIEGDALVTNRPGLAVAVKTADCFPILLADPVAHVVAAIHAGWRGTAAGIVTSTIERMRELYGSEPRDILAAIGPGIEACCFEVGPEVAREFAHWDRRLSCTTTKEMVDLAAANAHQLADSGVPRNNIAHAGLCTADRTDLFFSFRKERDRAGRMVSWIALRPDTTTGQ
jgi:YfiH family protein